MSQKIVQYLNEAHASEVGLVRVLQSQIAMTPRGSYRTALEKHLRETRGHAERVRERLRELEEGGNPLQVGLGLAETVVAQALALGKTPIDLLRGTSGAEKVLKNAKDASATEALEIATYTAIEALARAIGDDETARLAKSIRADEERMLARVLEEIPKLADAVARGAGYRLATTGAGETARAAARGARTTARKGAAKARSTARKAPGSKRAEGTVRGAVASESDLPIARYDSLNADEVAAKLPELSQADLAKVQAYERRHENRATVLSRIDSLRTREPWPGYDEQSVADIRRELSGADDDRARSAREYERAHKRRAGVLELTTA
jgi:ferritin-like metal-binding protein YciE